MTWTSHVRFLYIRRYFKLFLSLFQWFSASIPQCAICFCKTAGPNVLALPPRSEISGHLKPNPDAGYSRAGKPRGNYSRKVSRPSQTITTNQKHRSRTSTNKQPAFSISTNHQHLSINTSGEATLK